MNETVKLIIEIPKATYEDLKQGKIYSSLCEAPQGLIEGIRNGTPLDSNKGDLISRQAVLNELKKWDWQDLYLPSQFKQLLDDIPSGENKGEWVPITKWTPANDPPKKTGRYLVYIVNEYDEELQYIMTADYIARPTPIEGLSPWTVDDECASDNVVAWMPLPEGYKQEGDK